MMYLGLVTNALNSVLRDTVDFLKTFPPFHLMEEEALVRLSEHIELSFYKKSQKVFEEEHAPSGKVYVIKKGAVELKKGHELIDRCDAGDIFGVRSALSDNSFLVTANAQENSLIYCIPTKEFRRVLNENSKVNAFFLKGLASGLPVLTGGDPVLATANEGQSKGLGIKKLDDVSLIRLSKELVSCTPKISIQDAAKKMNAAGVGSILIVDDAGRPLGIATDSDFRRKVVAEDLSRHEPITALMSSPVGCVAPQPSVTEVLIRFVQSGVHHLCVTEDGTADTMAKGILSDHDVLVERGDHVGAVLKEIRKSKNKDQLASIRRRFQGTLFDFLEQEVSLRFITTITTEVNDAVIQKAMELCQKELSMDLPAEKYVWLNLGSEGRKEQLLQTDLDNALLFEVEPGEDKEETRSAYLKLAEAVVEVLVQCGFMRCPADMMASNPMWCLTGNEWKEKFQNWIAVPTEDSILSGNIFFDYRKVSGNAKLSSSLTDAIFNHLDKHEGFLSFMANNALKNPSPLSFFRNFVVEKDGEHADQFDLKRRAMMPLIDGARVLGLEARFRGINSTKERFLALAGLGKGDVNLYEDCAEAFDYLVRLRATQGMKNDDSGRFVNVGSLTKLERQTLRTIFNTVDRLQTHLKQRFRTDYFR